MKKTTLMVEEYDMSWGVQLALGVALLVAGVVAISMPMLVTLSIQLTLGWILIIVGFIQMIASLWAIKNGKFLISIMSGGLAFIVGLLLIYNPYSTIITATTLLGIFFLIEGILKITLSTSLKPDSSWKWVLASGIISITFSFLIIFNILTTSLFLIGLLVGINALFSGSAHITNALINKEGGDMTKSRGAIVWAMIIIFLVIFITLGFIS